MPLVEAKGLERTYQDDGIEVRALRGVDVSIEAGEFTAIAGPSGSGKTTLLNLIGLLDRPTGGTLRVDGVDVLGLSKTARTEMRLRSMGFVFQAYNLLPVLTAFENAEYTLLLQGVPAAERKRRAMALLTEVGLAGLEDRRPGKLSGGQQQRVAVARALASGPRLVLADEPTANLDSQSGAALLDLMASLNETKGVTFLFSTHDPMVIERARRLVRLRDGAILSDERR